MSHARQVHPPLPPPPPPPPPPPSSLQSAPPPTSAGQPLSRRALAQQALGISTTLTPAQRFGPRLQAHTPSTHAAVVSPASPLVTSASPSSSSSLASPMVSSRHGASATSTYNPQEWARSGSAAGQYVPHSSLQQSRRTAAVATREASGMEASMPSPPPPYSASPQSAYPPSRAQFGSPLAASFTSQTSSPLQYASEFSSPATPATSTSIGGFSSVPRSTSGEHPQAVPQQHSPSSYPPPPAAQRDRSSSRSRLVLSNLAGRHRTPSNASPSNGPDFSPQSARAGPAGGAVPLQTPAYAVPANVAPSSRRAASTGSVPTVNNGPTRRPAEIVLSSNPNEPHNHGFALPPPPPGPPPNARSQSLSRVGEAVAAPAPLRPTQALNQLGPVPPTPADWVEEDLSRQLCASTAAQSRSRPPTHEDAIHAAARESSVSRGIRERRSESRAKASSANNEGGSSSDAATTQAHAGAEAGEVRPANLVLSSLNGALSRRRHVSKARTSPLLDSRSSPNVQRRSDADPNVHSQPTSATVATGSSAPASPFPSGQFHQGAASNPPIGTPEDHYSVHGRPSLSTITPKQTFAGVNANRAEFAEACIERHLRFVELEARASSDQERLELFADFIVKESRLRRDKYVEAFDALGSNVLELTRDLWRSMDGKRSRTPAQNAATAESVTPESQQRTATDLRPEPSSAGSAPNSAALTPATEPESPSDLIGNHARIRSESRNAFQPMLSPIPSMAMSTAADEESVRGRSASRWWEESSDGASIGMGGKALRTKRESKYMGLPKEARENLQWIPEDSPGFAGPSSSFAGMGPNEYPAEKVGWHQAAYAPEPSSAKQTPRTPNIPRLDVSRLITLPPPYPRHHPAVNNNHPDLTGLRGILRNLTMAEQVSQIRSGYEQDERTQNLRLDGATAWTDRRKRMRQAIQQQVSMGAMSFAEAAQQEADFEAEEAKRGRDRAQKSFDHFQAQVVVPLNAQYKNKLNQASAAIEQLVEGLSNEASSHNPNATQEEGDEQPELLEKLTLVKWLHEAREVLYKSVTELEDESNEHFKSIVLLPYRQAGNRDKVQEVETFFAKDLCDRREAFEKKSLKRFEELLRTLEKHAMRGIDTQLSAFWDIAPELLAVVQKVPERLAGFEVQIPAHEYEENPAYEQFPLQYLFTLLVHAERSTHQFIESQINLQCLLHEVKTSVMVAGCRLMQTQRCMAGEEARSVEEEMQEIRRSEDATLTVELKERVAVVEEQWRQALGTGIQESQERIRRHLTSQGGFDESLQE